MNHYSRLQQVLHKLVLSSQMVRIVSFDVERALFGKNLPQTLDNHVFVAGMARSGSTVLLRALHQSDKFASLSYDDSPFILMPNSWSKLAPRKKHTELKERAHGDGIEVSTDSPEAFEEVFWNSFDSGTSEAKESFRSYVGLILRKYKKDRYLSKNNQNIRRLGVIRDIFPNSITLIPFRDPLNHTYSLRTQHEKFLCESKKDAFVGKYMKLIGHSEFGPYYRPIIEKNIQYQDTSSLNHWLEQWLLIYKSLFERYSDSKSLYLICYESLCQGDAVWTSLKNLVRIDKTFAYNFYLRNKQIDENVDIDLLNKCNAQYQLLKENSL